MAGSRAPTRAKGAPRPSEPGASREQCLGYLRQMRLIRHFEEKAGEAYSLGKIGGFCHLYITTSYRDHGHALARGLSARSVMAELYGKATGCSHGKGGSMHLFDASLGFLGGHGIVGGHIPLTAGMAFAAKYRKTDQVAVCYFGEAAVNIGSFHETLNMAALWKLPAIFVVENNGYGMGTALARASSLLDLAHRAYSYEMAEEVVDGQDVFAVRSAMDRAVERARMESLPTLLEMRTYRYVGHSMSDAAHGTYRSKEEVEEFRQRDPIKLLEAHMVAARMIDAAGLKALDAAIVAEVEDSVTFAEDSPDPAPDELWTDVLAGGR